MTLDPNSLIGRYYQWMFRGTLPNDFCTLFWNMLLSVIFLPMTCIVYPVALLFRTDTWESTLVGKVFMGMWYWVLFFIFPTVGLVIIEKYFTADWKTWNVWLALAAGWGATLLAGLAVAIAIAIIILICAGIMYVWDKVFDYRVAYRRDRRWLRELNGEPEPGNLRVLWDTIRNKYCTKINWKTKFTNTDVSDTN